MTPSASPPTNLLQKSVWKTPPASGSNRPNPPGTIICKEARRAVAIYFGLGGSFGRLDFGFLDSGSETSAIASMLFDGSLASARSVLKLILPGIYSKRLLLLTNGCLPIHYRST
jgi:hypothetical protein